VGAARRVCLDALDQGVIFRPLAGDVIGMSPPFVISDDQIDRMVAVLDKSVARVEKELKAGV
jgi:adenosylmethionine-8-amino-7-oxononanoate aminotransferase